MSVKKGTPRHQQLKGFAMKQTGSSTVQVPASFARKLAVADSDPARNAAAQNVDRQVNAQVLQQYGPKQTALTATAKAIPDWFKAYQATVNSAADSNRQAALAAQAQLAGLQGAVTGLGTAQAKDLQAGEAASSAVRGATAPTAAIGATATDAGGVRRDLLASFAATQAAQSQGQSARDAEQSRFAGGQQVQALSDNAKAQTQLATDRGTYAVTARQKLLDDMHQHALEDAAFKLNTTKATDAATAKANEVNQYGYSTAQWSQMTPAERLRAQHTQKVATTITPAKDTGKINQYGYTDADWRGMSTDQRRKIIAAGKSKPKAKTPKSPWVNPGAQGKVADSIGQALHYAEQARGQKLSRHDAAGLLVEGQKADPKTGATAVPSIDQLYASVALDIAFDGHISQANIKRLHARGVKVNALGYPTKGPKPARSLLDNVLHPGGA